MKYYITGSRIIEYNKDPYSLTCKCPLYMKKYPYYKLVIKRDGSNYLIQTFDNITIVEAKEVSLEEAQKVADEWALEHDKYKIDEKDFEGNLITNPDGSHPYHEEIAHYDIASYDHPEITQEMNRLFKGVN